MNDIIRNMMERRSIRKYSQEKISDDDLNLILQAGLYAPCAGNRQSAIVVACLDQSVNRELGSINQVAFKNAFSKIAQSVRENIRVSSDQPSIIDDASITDAFYGAPVVLTLFAPADSNNALADCCVMAQNIMLAAHSLGIGTCMVARTEEAFASEYGVKLQKEWGVGDNYTALVNIAMGYPSNKIAEAKPRKENRVKIVRA